LIEKYRLACAAKPNHHDAFGGAPEPKPLEADFDIFANGASTCKFRRRAASTWSKRITNRIHIRSSAKLCHLDNLINFAIKLLFGLSRATSDLPYF